MRNSIVLSKNNASIGGVRLLAVDYNQAEKEEMRNFLQRMKKKVLREREWIL